MPRVPVGGTPRGSWRQRAWPAHGGPIVLPVVDHRLAYVVAIVAGTIVTALLINALKRLTRGAVARNAEASP